MKKYEFSKLLILLETAIVGVLSMATLYFCYFYHGSKVRERTVVGVDNRQNCALAVGSSVTGVRTGVIGWRCRGAIAPYVAFVQADTVMHPLAVLLREVAGCVVAGVPSGFS